MCAHISPPFCAGKSKTMHVGLLAKINILPHNIDSKRRGKKGMNACKDIKCSWHSKSETKKMQCNSATQKLPHNVSWNTQVNIIDDSNWNLIPMKNRPNRQNTDYQIWEMEARESNKQIPIEILIEISH